MSDPYSSPSSDSHSTPTRRAKSPKVLGIIIIILSVLALVGVTFGLIAMFTMSGVMKMQLQLGYSQTYLIGSNVFSVIVTIWLFIVGIWLVKYKDIGRKHFNYYAILTVVMSIFNFFYIGTVISAAADPIVAQSLSMARYGGFISVALVVGAAYLLNRPAVKASLQ